jgi:hypothetical protein
MGKEEKGLYNLGPDLLSTILPPPVQIPPYLSWQREQDAIKQLLSLLLILGNISVFVKSKYLEVRKENKSKI